MSMDNEITAVFAIISWSAPFVAGKGGSLVIRRRESDIYKVTFQSESHRAAFHEAMRRTIADNGGEMILCQEVEGHYE